MKENEKSANATKRPVKCPSAIAPVLPGKTAAPPKEKPNKEKAVHEESAATRPPKATWRVTPSYGAEFLLAGQQLAQNGSDPWRLAMETRDMLIWRRQEQVMADGGKPGMKPAKCPVTWHVKG